MAIRVLPSRPGVYISEQSAGSPAISTALFQRTYILGTSTKGDLEPFQLGSYDDFINFFGNSEAVTKNTINAYLQNTKLGLFFVKVPTAYTSEVVLSASYVSEVVLSVFALNTVYTVTVGGAVFTKTAVSGDTINSIIDYFVTSINTSLNVSVNNVVMAHHIKNSANENDYSGRKFIVRSIDALTFTISCSTASASTPSNTGGFALTQKYKATIEGVIFEKTAVWGDKIQSAIDYFVEAINSSYAINNEVMAHHIKNSIGENDYSNGKFIVRSINEETFAISCLNASASNPSKESINYWDYVGATQRITNSYKTERLGFLVCPEAFYTLNELYERNIVANSMEAAARSLGWMTFIDAGSPNIVDRPSKLTSEFKNVASPRGHLAAYYPWLVDTNGNSVSFAAMTAGYALQRFEKEGIQHPPAGNLYPFAGISGVAFKLSDSQRDFLSDISVNPCIFRRGFGYVPYDVKTLSLNTDFRFINHRVIFSCIERTIFDTIENSNAVFSANGGGGVFYLTLRNIALDVLDTFYNAGALYGLTAGDAYDCRCDASIQTSEALERGIVTALIYAVPASTVRQIDAVVYRVKIGGIPQAILQTL